MKKNYFLFCLLSTLLLLGAGCTAGKQSPTATSTPSEPIIDTTKQQEAYLFCTQKGYDIQIRFVAAQNRNIAYCILNPNTECDSIAFLQGTCPTTATTTPEDSISQMFEPIPGDTFSLRLCEPIAHPVCGVDQNTYTNGCVADFLGVKIDHFGSCERAAAEPPPVNDSPVIDISNPPRDSYDTPPTAGTPQSATTNSWVEIPLSLLQSTAGSDRRIDRCTYNGIVTFYVHDEFPTLYTATGEAICYPEHDINNSCPEYILNGAYTNSCTRVSTPSS